MRSAGAAVRRFPWLDLGRRVVRQSLSNDVNGLAAELGFRFFLALFPFVIFLTAVGSFVAAALPVDNPTETIIDAIGALLPSSARSLVESELNHLIENRSTTLTSVSVVLALVFATGGMNAIIKALNRVYDVREVRPFFRRYPVALVLTLIAGTAMVAAFALFGPVRLLAPRIADILGIEEAAGTLVDSVAFLGALVLVVVAAALVYRLAPNIRLPMRAIWPGALLFAFGWLASAAGLSFYVTNFGNYANTYGALTGVALLLLWFYVSALVFLVAGEFNAALHTITAPGDLERRRVESVAEDSEPHHPDAQ